MIYPLASCTRNNSDLSNKENKISNISIFESGKNIGDKLNEKAVLVIENKEKIKLFSNLIDKAIKMDGILDIANPKYIAEISYSDKQETIYFNIVEEKGNYSGMFIKKGKTEEGYIFRKEDMEEFMKEYKEFLSINEDLTSNSESNEITIKNREWIYRIK